MPVHPNLKTHLEPVAARRGRSRFWWRLAAGWAGAAGCGLGILALERLVGWSSSLVMPIVALLGSAAAFVIASRRAEPEPDWRDLSRQIEAKHPDLDGRLITAVQQQAKGGAGLNYLQERLVREAALHGQRNEWREAVPTTRLVVARLANVLAVILFAAVLWQLRVAGGHALLARTSFSGVTVTPGDATVERGASLVVLARFGSSLPASVDLVLGLSSQASARIPLVKSLADPVFGGSVPEVTTDFVYHVEYGGHLTRDFRVTVFEHPRLERADADLTFPEYTGQQPRHIENTRRVSAVEGSHLDLTLELNKPVASARLVATDNDHIVVPLLAETNLPVARLNRFPLVASQAYQLQLVDADGRTNKTPAQFVFAVLTNRPPELRLASPRGDLRPSALEEVPFDGTVWDDFGVREYGLAYTLVGQPTRFIQLGGAVPAKEKRPFHYLLRLEDLKLQPDQLISWFVWADDVGPDGKVRRTPGDLFFGEVRPFDEVFREGQGMAGQQQGAGSGQQGGETARLAELQKQIINATWNLQREQSDKQKRVSGASDKSGSDSEKRTVNESFLDIPPRRANTRLTRNSSSHVGFEQESSPPAGLHAFDTPASEVQVGFRQTVPQFAGQLAPDSSSSQAGGGSDAPPPPAPPRNLNDAQVVREAQEQALEQAKATMARQRDPRTAALWQAAIERMEKAISRLKPATDSPGSLAEALTEEQAAYQALLRLQEHEYQVMRSRYQSQGGSGSRNQMMQRELDQLDLTQSANRYETERQAQAPQTAQRREQLQIMNRLQELARRQQDLNDRLKELQTALQAARTEPEREEIRRRLKRLEEEEQRMLADVDQVRQQMDQPENQSQMSDARRQLDQTRNEVERAAEAARQNDVSQALAAGTRAQRQLQQVRDQMRKENSSRFADDLRQMRGEARELANQQQDLLQKMNQEAGSDRKTLAESPESRDLLNQLARQRERLTNLVARAERVSQQAEASEPLLSRQLYDTVRQFSQNSAKNLNEIQDQLLNQGLVNRDLYDRLKDPSVQDGAKLMDVTSALLRLGFLPPAAETARLSQTNINQFKQGVERAAESVLGDDTDALRLAQQELNQLTDPLKREVARGEAGNVRTNQQIAQASSTRENNRSVNSNGLEQSQNSQERQSQAAQAGDEPRQTSEQANSRENTPRQGNGGQQPNQETASAREDQQAQSNTQNGPQQPGEPAPNDQRGERGQRQTGQGGRNRDSLRETAQRGGQRLGGNRFDTASAGGEGGGDLRNAFDRLFDANDQPLTDPLTGDDFVRWSERLRDVEDMLDAPDLRNQVAVAGERARVLRQEYRRDDKKPDWAVVRVQIVNPLVEVQDRIAEELARRESRDALVPLDRDPVPSRYSELVRKYYEELGKDQSEKGK